MRDFKSRRFLRRSNEVRLDKIGRLAVLLSLNPRRAAQYLSQDNAPRLPLMVKDCHKAQHMPRVKGRHSIIARLGLSVLDCN
jgi:hypothetical protein